jgi:hypothetical protein
MEAGSKAPGAMRGWHYAIALALVGPVGIAYADGGRWDHDHDDSKPKTTIDQTFPFDQERDDPCNNDQIWLRGQERFRETQQPRRNGSIHFTTSDQVTAQSYFVIPGTLPPNDRTYTFNELSQISYYLPPSGATSYFRQLILAHLAPGTMPTCMLDPTTGKTQCGDSWFQTVKIRISANPDVPPRVQEKHGCTDSRRGIENRKEVRD